jgi:hypothetical protein
VTPNAKVIDGGDASVRDLTIGISSPDFTGDLSIINGGTLTAHVVRASGPGSAPVRVSPRANVVAFGGRGTGTLSVLDGGAVVVDIG